MIFLRLLGVLFSNSCFGSSFELAEAGRKVMEIVLEQNTAEKDRFLPGLTCAAIYEIKDKKKTKRNEPENALPMALEALGRLKENIKSYEVDDINPIIRALGRRRLVTPIFELLDSMRDAGTYMLCLYVHAVFVCTCCV